MICATAGATPASEADVSRCVQELARQRLSDGCPYAFYFQEIECDFADGVLTLSGRVPTFYLKQILQARLLGLDGVAQVRNQVDVVNSSGISSVRPGY